MRKICNKGRDEARPSMICFWRATLCRGLLFFSMSLLAFAQQYEQADTDDLAQYPKDYWARGIVFRDTLESAPEPGVMKVNNRSVYYVKLKKLGRCYADAVVAPALGDLKTGQDYLFAGTVLEVDKDFCVVIQGLVSRVRDFKTLPAEIEEAAAANKSNSYQRTLTQMTDMINGIEADLVSYSKNHNIPMSDLFDPLSKNNDIVVKVTQTAVQSMADQLKTTPNDLLADFITALLAERHPAVATNTTPSVSPK